MMHQVTKRAIRWTPLLAVAVAAGCADPASIGDASLPPIAATDLPAAQEQVYHEDAVRLAFRELNRVGAPARSSINPPEALVQSLFNALAAVHATSHPARDSVVEIYAIRTFPYPATREIMVQVLPSHLWTRAWQSKKALTGNPEVDALVRRYNLSVREYYFWSFGEVALLRAADPLNAAALARRFDAIPGIVWAQANGAMGDGNDIRAFPRDDGWRLDYSVGFGDCPVGCTGRRTWSFVVAADGSVAYLGAFGPPVPEHWSNRP